ncbi:GNAT family N-acetyltransferase [Nocardioides sp. NPDC058538]|uniref:GNAT family N-acetyltransferase n=1 Tax=Nocardioides sp. NPDC058538 TaxID=3346542 RepID=UPI00365F35B6
MASVLGDAIEYLVTEDAGIHRRAGLLGVSDRVLTLADATAMLANLHAAAPTPPPSVKTVKTHELSLDDPIFDGLKDDYAGFESWFKRAARTQRDALLIDGGGRHAAIAIIKKEPGGEFGLPGPQLKICTFKVAAEYSGQKYGELLLKALFDRSRSERSVGLYVTVLDKQSQLIALLRDFGFEPLNEVRTEIGEMVFAKPHNVPPVPGLSALASHIRYGTPCVTLDGTQPFVVPIEPRWHRVLFPDAEPPDDGLFPATLGLSTKPFGNALRKAYLCNAPTRLLRPGDPLLFYRSRDEKAVYVVGVCEDTLVSRNPDEVVAAVGRRTVYSLDEIRALTRLGEVLVVMFRQDRVFRDDPLTIGELQAGRVLRSWPQSITRTRKEGASWLAQRLAV